MIEILNLSKTFDKGKITALNSVSCNIENNKIVGLIGPDGSGKTTFLRIMAGILTPSSGEIKIDGIPLDIFDKKQKGTILLEELHEMIAYMPQKFGLYEDLSIIENLDLYAKLKKLTPQEKKIAFEEVLEMTKLKAFQKRLAGNLSGGMKQKLGLACSLLKKPKILILDEPSVGVDPISRHDLILMVNTMLDKNTTVLWSTAYLDEAEKLDYVLLLNDGVLKFEGAPKEAMDKISGRVFGVKYTHALNKRDQASEILKTDGVIDSIIQGQYIRFITSHAQGSFVQGATLIRPTFEDACVDMLGGLREKESPLKDYLADFKGVDTEFVVEAQHLTKKFGNFCAVDDVSFGVKRGKIFGLLGPNGSGKSTTFKMLCGLLKQNNGTAKIAGIDIAKLGSDAKLNIGYMAQKFSLYSILSLRQNLDFFSGAYRLAGKQRKDVVENMMEMFHMQHLQNVNAGILSLGFKQRLALACAIMHKPSVLFLDEPTSGVDPITRKEFWLHINAMVSRGVSIVVTTHFMDEAENCDDIALVYKGKIRVSGDPDSIKSICKTSENEFPTFEESFIKIVQQVDEEDCLLEKQFDE